jgi:hypothetical protein
MNLTTKSSGRAIAKAIDLANIRRAPVWLFISTSGQFHVDNIPHWWTAEDIARKKALGEIVEPAS